MITFYFDLDTRQVFSNKTGTPVGTVPLKLRDQVPVTIVFLRRGTPRQLVGTPTISLGLKGELADVDFVAVCNSFSYDGEDPKREYTGTLDLTTAELLALFDADQEFMDLFGEIYVEDDTGTLRSGTLDVRVDYHVTTGDEGSPTPLPDADDFVADRAVLYDRSQALSTPQKAQARTNIGAGDAVVSGTLDQFSDVTQTGGATLAISASTTLSGGTHSGTNTGDQTSVTGNAGTVTTINGRISAGTNVTLSGSGTAASPYVIDASGGGGGGAAEYGDLTDAGTVDLPAVNTPLGAALDLKAPIASPAFTGQGTIEGDSNPVWDMRRTSASTNSGAGAGQLTAISAGDMVDGFGPLLSFRVSDTGVSNELIGAVGFVRAGADNTGDFVVRPQVAGSAKELFRVKSTGALFFPSTNGGTDGVTVSQDTFERASTIGWPSLGGYFAMAAADSGRVAPTDMTGLGTGVADALAVNTGSPGAVLIRDAAASVTTLAASGAVTMTANTASTSISTGTLVVTGGAGFSGAVWAGNSDSLGFRVSSTVFLSSAGCSVESADSYAFGVRSKIFSSADGEVSLRNNANSANANLTLGNFTASGTITATPQALSGAGAVNATTSATAYTSTGVAQALTLANGTADGQLKIIAHVSRGSGTGTGILTPTTANGFSTVTLTGTGAAVLLQWFTTGGWIVAGSNANATVA